MTKADIDACTAMAKSMDWEELVDIIIDITLEFEEMESYLSDKDKENYEKTLLIYEDEKETRLNMKSNFSPRQYNFCGEDYANDWDGGPEDDEIY